MSVSFQVGDREFGGSGNLDIDFWVRTGTPPFLFARSRSRQKHANDCFSFLFSSSRTRCLTVNITNKRSPRTTIPSLPSPTENTTTASATRDGRLTPRRYLSTCMESCMFLRRRWNRILWTQKVRRLCGFLLPPSRCRFTNVSCPTNQSVGFRRHWLRLRMSNPISWWESGCTGTRQRAPTREWNGGVSSSLPCLSERECSRFGGWRDSSRFVGPIFRFFHGYILITCGGLQVKRVVWLYATEWEVSVYLGWNGIGPVVLWDRCFPALFASKDWD